MDMFNIHKLGSSSPKQRKGQLGPSQNQVCPMKVTTVCNRLFLGLQILCKMLGLSQNCFKYSGSTSNSRILVWVYANLFRVYVFWV